MQFGGRTLEALPILHELDDGLSYWRTVECRAVLHLNDLIPIEEELLRAPAHHLVDRCGVLTPVGQPGSPRQLQGRLTRYCFANTPRRAPSSSARSASKRSHNSSSVMRLASGMRSNSTTRERSSTSPRSLGTLMALMITARLSSIITSSSSV